MSASTSLQSLQRNGRLIDPDGFRVEGEYQSTNALDRLARDAAEELASPCYYLRMAALRMDLDRVIAGESIPTPFPLTDIFSVNGPTSHPYSCNGEFAYRYHACLINEVIATLQASAKEGLNWYKRQLITQVTSARRILQKINYSLPTISNIRAEVWDPMSKPEPMPQMLDINESQYLDGSAWPFCEIKLANSVVQEAWLETMLRHTVVLVCMHDSANNERHFRLGYTLPQAPKGKDAGPSQAADAGSSSSDPKKVQYAFPLRLSHYGWSSMDGIQTLEKRRATADAIVDQYSRWSTRRTCELRLVRLDSLFMAEDNLSAIKKLDSHVRDLLLRPDTSCVSFDFQRLFKEDTDVLYTRFADLVRSYTLYSQQRPSPQQLRFYMAFLLRLLSIVVKDVRIGLVPLRGPPGTGKTSTIAQIAVLKCNLAFMMDFVRLTASYIGLGEGHDIDAIATRLQTYPMVYIAPTNDAVDAGCSAINEAFEDSHVDGNDRSKAWRVSDIFRALERPHLIDQHISIKSAEELTISIQTEVDAVMQRMEDRTRIRGQRAQEIAAEENRLKALGAYTYDLLVSGNVELINKRYFKEHGDLLGDKAADEDNKTKGVKISNIKHLSSYIQNPVAFMDAKAASTHNNRTRYEVKSVLRMISEHTESLQQSATSIFCFTAGYANPYHPEVETFCKNAFVIFDEASQATYPEVIKVISKAKAVAMIGDTKQLGPVLFAAPGGNMDFRHTLMRRIEPQTMSLSICWRLPVEMTAFLHRHVYNSSGLYHPSAQNILRSSPIHTFPLFRPTIILDVPGGIAERPVGSTSKINKQELWAVFRWLEAYALMSAQFDLKAVTVAIVSPYAAQAAELEHIASVFRDVKAFSSIVTGSIERIQGATVDICICSVVMAQSLHSSRVGIEFLSAERLNVSVSRAKMHMVLVCNRWDILSARAINDQPMLRQLLSTFPRITATNSGLDVPSGSQTSSQSNSLLPVSCNAPAHEGSPWAHKGQPDDELETLLDSTAKLSLLNHNHASQAS